MACWMGVTGFAFGEPAGAAFDLPEELPMPQVEDSGRGIDLSHVSDGYVVVRASGEDRMIFQAVKDGTTCNYDLPNDGTPAVIPVSMGSGVYRFRIMKNVGGDYYTELDSVKRRVVLDSGFAPFIIPNRFCDYDESSACVAKARELTRGAGNQAEAAKRICEFVVENVSYDKAKADRLSKETGYVPDPDETLASGSGICFDYASLGAAMLRSVGIPAKIITGYVSSGSSDDLYHAWVMVYVDGSWRSADFSVAAGEWSRIDLTAASAGSSFFSSDKVTYKERYVY